MIYPDTPEATDAQAGVVPGCVVPGCVAPGLTAGDRRSLAASLRDALAGGTLALHYQPQASLRDGMITGYEALLRWRHTTRGLVPPATVIPVAEEAGLASLLGAWVLRRACAEAASWAHPWRVAVNLSPRQLADPGLPALIAATLAAAGLVPWRLELELAEAALIRAQAPSRAALRAIAALGVGIALDNAGAGPRAPPELGRLPLGRIKLDRALTAELEAAPGARAALCAMVAHGQRLGITMLAEGVERASQMALLREAGCDEAQGFLLGRPGPYVALENSTIALSAA